MNTKSLLLLLAILILLAQPALSFAKGTNVEEQPQTGVRILPAQTANVAVGDSFSVNVSVENCTNVYAVQMDIHYDPTVLQAISITPGSTYFPLRARAESNIYDEELNMTYNGPAYAQIFYVASASGDVPGLNGGALLFTVTFEVISEGSSSIQLTPYPGGGGPVGTYFVTPPPQMVEVVPQLYSANYGQSISPPASSSQNTSGNNGQVLSGSTLPYLMPFAFAALFLVVIRRKVARKTPNQ